MKNNKNKFIMKSIYFTYIKLNVNYFHYIFIK